MPINVILSGSSIGLSAIGGEGLVRGGLRARGAFKETVKINSKDVLGSY
jgi:hypothetical protein